MIRNSALAERLNAHKNGEVLPEIKPVKAESHEMSLPTKDQVETSLLVQLMSMFTVFAYFIVRCLGYGYALHIIFKTDWTFLPIAAIGFSVELLSTKIFGMFNKS
jgi:hypothetical protein